MSSSSDDCSSHSSFSVLNIPHESNRMPMKMHRRTNYHINNYRCPRSVLTSLLHITPVRYFLTNPQTAEDCEYDGTSTTSNITATHSTTSHDNVA